MTYSDWRLRAPIESCPECNSAELRSRDTSGGMEVGCVLCDWRRLLDIVPPISRWPHRAIPPIPSDDAKSPLR